MNEIVKKQTDLQDMVRNKEDMLLTRVQSFTSKEVSEACRGMSEELLERTALMCERIHGKGQNPSDAARVVSNLSKKGVDGNRLQPIIEKFESSPDTWFFRDAEKLSKSATAEKLLASLPLVERISNWNKRAFAPSVRIDEDRAILLTSELVNSVNEDTIKHFHQLCEQCSDRMIKPDDLFTSIISISRKNPSQQQFDDILKEFSKLIPVLRSESETASKFFLDEPGDEKIFWHRKPEWTLSHIAEKASLLAPDEFLKYLKEVRNSEDYYLDFMRRKGECEHMTHFKNDLNMVMTWNAGALAMLLTLAEDPNAYQLVENALKQRNEKGYKEEFDYAELFDPIKILNGFLSRDGKPLIPYHPPEQEFPELMKQEVTYADLKKMESHSEVIDELRAASMLFKDYRSDFERRISTLTYHMDVHIEELKKTILSALEITAQKHLYGGERFSFADIGTASGSFTKEPIAFVRQNFPNPLIIRVNPTPFEIEHHQDLKVLELDATSEKLPQQVNMLVVKDVMKFMNEEGRAKVWENVKQSVAEGGHVFSGSTQQLPYSSAYKMHVKVNGELVKVDEDKFIEELKNVKDEQDLMRRLAEIVERCRLN